MKGNRSEIMKELLTELKQVPDPEVGINIIDLGLVYGISLDEGQKTLDLFMTLSTPSCPLGDIITMNAEHAIRSVLPDHSVKVSLVWDPQWRHEFISEEGKKELGIL